MRRGRSRQFVFLLLVAAAMPPAIAGEPGGRPEVRAEGSSITVGGVPLFLKGVDYSPYIAGDAPGGTPTHVDFRSDLTEIKNRLHANAVRVYDPLPAAFYTAAGEAGIWVIQGIPLATNPPTNCQSSPAWLLAPAFLAAQKNAVRAAIDLVHSRGGSDVVLAYAIGSGIAPDVIAQTIRCNAGYPRYRGTYYRVPDATETPRANHYALAGCPPPPVPAFLDPHPFQSFLAELADAAALHEEQDLDLGYHHLFGHAATPAINPFLGARDRAPPELLAGQPPVDLSFLDVIFENVFTYSYPYIAYHGLPDYLRLLKTAYPSKPVIVLETGYSTSAAGFDPPPALCGYPRTTPVPLTLGFGGASEAEQAQGIEERWVDVAGAARPLAGFFVYGFYEEWWFAGSPAVQDNEPLEFFGLKRVRAGPAGYEVSEKPAYARLAELYGAGDDGGPADGDTLAIRAPLVVSAGYGRALNHAFTAAGGTPPYRWSLADPAALPAGVAFDAGTGRLEGAPERIGDFRFRLRLEDSSQAPLALERLLVLRVAAPRFITRGREIFIQGEEGEPDRPFYLRGIDYSPFTGGDAPFTTLRRGTPGADMREIKDVLHANAIRLYQTIPRKFYDEARASGLFIVQGIHLQVDNAPAPGTPECFTTPLDVLEPALFARLRDHVLAEIDDVHSFDASDLVVFYVIGNELNFCVERSTILKHRNDRRYAGKHYSAPTSARLPPCDNYPGCAPHPPDCFVDPHPFQSFLAELADVAACREEERYGIPHHLTTHATDPNLSIAVGARDFLDPELHFPFDTSFLDLIAQNVYGYFPPYLRFVGYRRYLLAARDAYPDRPFVVLECGYSTSPDVGAPCAADALCGQPAVPQLLSLCFGQNTEEEQAQGIFEHFQDSISAPGLTAGFFVFEYFDEWWKGAGPLDEKGDNQPEEWFGIKDVSRTGGQAGIRNKIAFETTARMFDMSWCPGIELLHCAAEPGGVRLTIEPLEAYDRVTLKRGTRTIAELGPGELSHFDPAPPAGEIRYTATVAIAFAECPPLECTVTYPPLESFFRRGDANTDGQLNITDAVTTFNYLFLSVSASPACLDAVDANDDAQLNLTDGVYSLNFLFLGGPSLPAPTHAACGGDLAPDAFAPCVYPPGSCDG